MLTSINLVANAIIFMGSLWAVLTHKVPNRTGGAMVLFLLNLSAFGNMVMPGYCHSQPEVASNVAVAMGVLWAFWRLELRHWFKKGAA